MKLRASTTSGAIAAAYTAEYLAGEKAVTQAMRGAAQQLKSRWRADIAAANLGQKLANTIRSASYPTGTVSIDAAALAWTKAPKIIGAYESGALIHNEDGFMLAIPTAAAGRLPGGRKMSPGAWERKHGRRLRAIRRGSSTFLIDDGTKAPGNVMVRKRVRGGSVLSEPRTWSTGRTVVIFVLVRQVRLPKRLDLVTAAEQVAGGIPAAIVNGWPNA